MWITRKYHNFADLQEALAKHRPGDKVTVKLIRDKKEKTVEVTLKNEQGYYQNREECRHGNSGSCFQRDCRMI